MAFDFWVGAFGRHIKKKKINITNSSRGLSNLSRLLQKNAKVTPALKAPDEGVEAVEKGLNF